MERTTYPPIACPKCNSVEILTLLLTVAGRPATFAACNACEWKGWEREGERMPLRSLLGLIAAR